MNDFACKLLEFKAQDAVNAAKREGALMAYKAKLRASIGFDLIHADRLSSRHPLAAKYAYLLIADRIKHEATTQRAWPL